MKNFCVIDIGTNAVKVKIFSNGKYYTLKNKHIHFENGHVSKADIIKYVEEFMAEHFPEIVVHPLEGTYLQWLDLRGLGMTHVELKIMLEGAQIYLDNGELFGEAGRGFQRINLACARQTLERTMERFRRAVAKVRAGWEKHGKPYHHPQAPHPLPRLSL